MAEPVTITKSNEHSTDTQLFKLNPQDENHMMGIGADATDLKLKFSRFLYFSLHINSATVSQVNCAKLVI
jgi:hypothetical protein